MASRLLVDLSGIVKADGTCVITSDTFSTWCKIVLNFRAAKSPTAAWTIGIGGGGLVTHALGYGSGPTMYSGPFIVSAGEQFIVSLTGGVVGDAVIGVIYGIQDIDPNSLSSDTPIGPASLSQSGVVQVKGGSGVTVSGDGTGIITITGGGGGGAGSYTLLSTQTLLVTTSGFTIPIPAGYKDIAIQWSLRTVAAATVSQIIGYFNIQDLANSYYAFNSWYIDGNLAPIQIEQFSGGTQFTKMYCAGNNSVAGGFGTGEIYLPQYSSSTQLKTWRAEYLTLNEATINNASGLRTGFNKGYWWNPTLEPITRMILGANSTSYAAGSTISVYGIS